jgi:hypothetical protein
VDDLPKYIKRRQHLTGWRQEVRAKATESARAVVRCCWWLVFLSTNEQLDVHSWLSAQVAGRASGACPIESIGIDITMKRNVARALIEVGFIIFLFYSNLLMGEFERSGMGSTRGMAWAIGDILTAANFAIALIAALIGYALFEFLRNRL